MVYLIIIGVLLVFGFIFFKSKRVVTDSLTLVTGGVKSGKTTFALYLTFKTYRRNLRQYYFKCALTWFTNLFRRRKRLMPEKPLLYSNIPLKCKFVPLTTDLLLRKKRFAYNSVVYCGEASLVADSMSYRDLDINERLLLFNKLIAHELRGGAIIYDTQSVADLHYSMKRSLSHYFYVKSTSKFIPFILISNVIELIYSEDNSISFAQNTDADDLTKKVFYFKSIWHKFDCYTYSILTDDLPVVDTVVDGKKLDNLKSFNVVSVKKYNSLEGVKKIENCNSKST